MKIEPVSLIFILSITSVAGAVFELKPTEAEELTAREIGRAYSEVVRAARPPPSPEKQEEMAIRGAVMIEGAYRQLEKRNWVEGVRMLQLGLGWNPRDRQARMRLVALEWQWGFPARARRTAYDEFVFGYPGRKYMEQVLELMGQGDEPDRQLELIATVLHGLGAEAVPKEEKAWLLGRQALALTQAERWDDALSLVRTYSGEMKEQEWREIGVLALCGAKRFGAAETWIDEWAAKSGREPAVLRLRARVCREAGKLDEMAFMLEELIRRDPTDARARAFFIIQHLLAGMNEEAGKELDRYLLRFGADPANLQLLALPLAEIEREDMLAKVETAAEQQGIKDLSIAASRLDLMVRQGRWVEAEACLEKMRRDFAKKAEENPVAFRVTACLLNAVRNSEPEAQTELAVAMRLPVQKSTVYRECVKALRRAGRQDTAFVVAKQGLAIYDRSRFLKSAVSELERHSPPR